MPNTKKVRSRIEGQFQRAEGEQQKIPILDIGGDEEVEGLRLVDEWGAVARQFQYPALVDLETGLEDVLFLLGQELEMLDRAALLQDGVPRLLAVLGLGDRSEEHTSELQSLMRISYAVFCLKKKKIHNNKNKNEATI